MPPTDGQRDRGIEHGAGGFCRFGRTAQERGGAEEGLDGAIGMQRQRTAEGHAQRRHATSMGERLTRMPPVVALLVRTDEKGCERQRGEGLDYAVAHARA